MTCNNSTLTQERLKEFLHYNPETGIFTWVIKPSKKVKIGVKAGSSHNDGYISITINGIQYLAHRLAFLYMEGSFPPNEVDHNNRIRNDNRWHNLRRATSRENKENKINNTKFIGVCFHRHHNKWQVQSARHRGKLKHLGLFKTHLAACYARWAYDQECR